MCPPKVCVMMSTYNGEKYIREQIKSILDQKSVNVTLLIRDDGSSDSTFDIIRECSKDHDNIIAYAGENLGVGKSFIQLLIDAPEADYYSFADQDDVWLETKLSQAIKKIMERNNNSKDAIPILYGSNQTLVDKDLNFIGLRFFVEPKHDLLQEICFNKISGCTMVMNSKLRRELISSFNLPPDIILTLRLHDTWCMIVANILGEIIFDQESYILYRQHENNVVGEKRLSLYDRVHNKIERWTSKRYKGSRSLLAKVILEKFGPYLKKEEYYNIDIIANSNTLSGALRLIDNQEVNEHFKENNIVLFLKCIFKWI